jgi:hypothetical protein
MALIVLAAGSGSPGTTTAALGLALAWPRPVLLVEADPAGASAVLAGFCRGTVAHDRGLVDLAVAQRNGEPLADAIEGVTIELPGTGVPFVPGPSRAASATSLPELWPALIPVLRARHDAGSDVIVDFGRLSARGSADALLTAADLVLLVTRSRLVDIAVARSRAAALLDEFGDRSVPVDTLRLLLVGEGRPYGRREVAAATGLVVAGALPWDPAGAAVYSDGEPRGRRAPRLERALGAAAGSIANWLGERPALRGAA